MIAEVFKGHGCFLYDARETLAKFGGNAGKLADAMANARMHHAWVRLHDVVDPEPFAETRDIIQALKAKGIHVAGYGWCHGRNPIAEASLAVNELNRHGLVHYVANIEEGKEKKGYGKSHWTSKAIDQFFISYRKIAKPESQVVISTYPYIGEHAPELMVAADMHVAGFAPQIYWFNYPASWMWPRKELPPDASYEIGNPASYARLCLDMWRYYTRKPLVVTGQAYWSAKEHAGFNRTDAEVKLSTFLRDFGEWNRIVGINWWHLGNKIYDFLEGAMSEGMTETIIAANVDGKPYSQD